MIFHIPTAQAMETFGAKLAKACPPGIVIYLRGELGVGKTTLVRGFLRGLGFKGKVKSPTYTLVESYYLDDKVLYHFDLYRLVNPQELEEIGIRDYVADKHIILIEWPNQGEEFIPLADLVCDIDFVKQGREVQIKANADLEPVQNLLG